MILEKSEILEELITGCENNIEALRTCRFSYNEKRQLRKIYNDQILKYKQERLSFLELENY